MPPNASTRRRHEPLEVGGAREVARHGERADPGRLALDDVGAAREHRDVRALRGERLGDREAHALGGAEHDRAPSVKAEIHRPGSVPGRLFRTCKGASRAPVGARAALRGRAQALLSTPTTSRTAAAEARSIFFSSAESLSFTISSTPLAPSLTGTPM